MTDYVSAISIAARATVKQPIVADLISTYKRAILTGLSEMALLAPLLNWSVL